MKYNHATSVYIQDDVVDVDEEGSSEDEGSLSKRTFPMHKAAFHNIKEMIRLV